MPVTFWTMLIGTLALVGTPFFSGFYSKDTIIEAAGHHAAEAGHWIATYGYWAVLLGAFVTSFYSFRLLYLTFFGAERFRDAHGNDHAHDAHDDHGQHGAHEPHESPWVVTLPLVLLAIPSIVIGFLTAGPMLFGTDMMGHVQQLPYFLGSIEVSAARDVVAWLSEELWHGPVAFALHGFKAPTFWLAFGGFLLATLMYWWKPDLHGKARRALSLPVRILEDKYGFDRLWIQGFAGGGIALGKVSRQADERVIDGFFVNGSTRVVAAVAGILRKTQSGFLYDYAFVMILGLIALLAVLLRYWH